MCSPKEPVMVLGAGIGGLSTSYQLLKMGIPVTLIERSNELGGLMRSVRRDGYCVDLGQKQYYDRIPPVQEFFGEVLGEDLLTYPYRIGVLYRGKVYERERAHRGALRGLSPGLLMRGMGDLFWQRLKYKWKPKVSLEDTSYAQKGKLFSQIFSQGFDEKLKCRPWQSVLLKDSSRALTGEDGGEGLPNREGGVQGNQEEGRSNLSQNREENIPENRVVESEEKAGLWTKLLGLLNRGTSGQEEWWHPRQGSGGLVEALRKGIVEMGGEIRLNTEVSGISREGNRITEVELYSQGDQERIPVRHLVSTLRLEILASILGMETSFASTEISFQRGVVLLYLFIDAPSNFPHTCLYVTDRGQRIGRITNYGAYGCDMVPEGKSCLSFEVFCKVDDPFLKASDSEVVALVREEMDKSGLVNWDRVASIEVFKLPLGDAATNWSDYKDDPSRLRMYKEVSQIENLYQVSRSGMDKTIYAGLMAAKSIEKKDHELFLQCTSPEDREPWVVSGLVSG